MIYNGPFNSMKFHDWQTCNFFHINRNYEYKHPDKKIGTWIHDVQFEYGTLSISCIDETEGTCTYCRIDTCSTIRHTCQELHDKWTLIGTYTFIWCVLFWKRFVTNARGNLILWYLGILIFFLFNLQTTLRCSKC